MTQPPQTIQAPSGYSFFVGDYLAPMFQDPEGWGITDPDSAEAKRMMVIHQVCGVPVIWGMIATHEAWHASLDS